MDSSPIADKPTSGRPHSNAPRSRQMRCLCSRAICKLCASLFHSSSPISTDSCHFGGGSVIADAPSVTPPPSPESLASLRARGGTAPTNAKLSKSRLHTSAPRRAVEIDPAQRLSLIMEGEEPVVSGAERDEDADNTATLKAESQTVPPQQCTGDLGVRVEAQHHHVYCHLNSSVLSLNPDMYYFPEMDLNEERKIRRVGADLYDEAIGVAIGAEAYLFGMFVAERFGLL